MSRPRLILSLASFIASFLILGTSHAGNASSFNSLGFSKDGKYFAFEEYGDGEVEDDGFSSIYVIDTVRDRWVKPSPYRVINVSDSVLATNRSRLLKKAQKQLRKLGINQQGNHLVSRKITDIGLSNKEAIFNLDTHAAVHQGEPFSKLTINVFPMETSVDFCDESVGFSLTYALSYTDENEAEISERVYRDKSLSKSRGCPLDYSIAEIIERQDTIVAMIYVMSTGFEGKNMRLIAIPFTAPVE